MLKDFHNLLPELYGERSCTANAHALLHISAFVRYWGPLWTHSSFSYESKNGHLKSMIHGKCHALDQLMFAVDATLTLQQHKSELFNESEGTVHFISKVSGQKP